MSRPDDGEVPAIERGQSFHPETLARGDDRGLHDAERQVGVLIEQLGYPAPVLGLDRLDVQFPLAQRASERLLGGVANAIAEEVRHLGHDQRGHDERTRRLRQQGDAARMVPIARGRGSDERPRVDDEHQLRGRRPIARRTYSSTRSEASAGPPSPTAKKASACPGRGAGKCFSTASRTTSASGIPRRLASSRRRASTASHHPVLRRRRGERSHAAGGRPADALRRGRYGSE